MIVNMYLLIIVLFILIAWLIPPAPNCWIPPNAPTRGIYAECWTYDEVRHR